MSEIVITRGAEEPEYQQLARQLRDRIIGGTYAVGQAIPSIQRLSQETGLAVMTIRKAVDVLEGEGLVRATPSRGTYVISQTPRQPGEG